MDVSKSTPTSVQVSSGPRVTKHKEKFLAMKEKYEQVVATHEKYERELALANEKIRNLQNECNLLLDAVDIAVPGQPTLMHYLQHDPIPTQYSTTTAPVYPELIPMPPPPAEPVEIDQTQGAPQTNGANGH
ncbi:hypothetical protein BDW22DRAFT_1361294 [Trametopsis cervina]|nr:hypothetical protein BDW22DRAFT_1361294 [Trametopsis cervina]